MLKDDNNNDEAVMWLLGILTAWQLIHCEESSFFSSRKKCICQRYQDVRFLHNRKLDGGADIKWGFQFMKHKCWVSVIILFSPSYPFSKLKALYPYSVILIFFLPIAIRALNTSHSLSYICLGVSSNGMEFLFHQKQGRLWSSLVKPDILNLSCLLNTCLSGKCFLSSVETL